MKKHASENPIETALRQLAEMQRRIDGLRQFAGIGAMQLEIERLRAELARRDDPSESVRRWVDKHRESIVKASAGE